MNYDVLVGLQGRRYTWSLGGSGAEQFGIRQLAKQCREPDGGRHLATILSGAPLAQVLRKSKACACTLRGAKLLLYEVAKERRRWTSRRYRSQHGATNAARSNHKGRSAGEVRESYREH